MIPDYLGRPDVISKVLKMWKKEAKEEVGMIHATSQVMRAASKN